MKLNINTIIILDNKERFILLNETTYSGKEYFLAMGIDENKELITSSVVMLEEVEKNNEIFVKKETDQEVIKVLTRLFKAQN